MTIAGLMMIVALVAFYVWVFRESVRHAVSPLWFLAIAVVFGLVCVLIQIKWTQWISADPDYAPIDAASDQVPLRVAESIAEMAPRVEALGFRSLGLFRSARTTANGAAYISLFENPGARCIAQFFTVFVATGPIRRVVTILHFKTAFTDGTALGTSNNTVLGFFPAVRSREGSMAFPWIGDPRTLYEIHEASVAHYAADGIPCETDIRDPAAFLRSSGRDEIAKYAEVGYLRLDEPRRVYRYTWKGAILGVCKLTWPVKPIRKMLRRWRAKAILRELGLDGTMSDVGGYDRVSLPR
jgi:hypothetical protein